MPGRDGYPGIPGRKGETGEMIGADGMKGKHKVSKKVDRLF